MAIFVEGRDARTGLTATDTSAITILSVGPSATFYALLGTYCTSYGSGTGVYTLTWTQDGGARTLVTGSQSGADAWVNASSLIVPDKSTTVTGKLTGTVIGSTVINVDAVLLQVL